MSGICGMMLRSSSSWKSGAAGRSSVRRRKREMSVFTDAASSKRRRSPASALAVIICDSTFSLPWKMRWMMLLPGLVLEPPSARWRLFRNQERNSTGSDCAVSVNFLFDCREMAWRSSWGETWDLKARGFHILRIRVEIRFASSGAVSKDSSMK